MSKPADKTSRQQKKAYRAPVLRTFGTVQQITQTNLMTGGKLDNVMERKTGITGAT